jgi:hypothetical protein
MKDYEYISREGWEAINEEYQRRLKTGLLSFKEKRPGDWTEEDVDACIEFIRRRLP